MGSFIEYRGFGHVLQGSGPWFWWLVGAYLSVPIVVYFLLPFIMYRRPRGNRKTVSILVLGDLGHSPRMCYHALSFSKLDYYVNLCGYLESEPPTSVIEDINIDIRPIAAIKNKAGLPYLMFAAQKILLQFYQLFQLLLDVRGSDFYLIQNPPSIPLLLVLVVFMKLFSRDSKLVIDWHNLNYSILNLKYQNLNHPLVKFLKAYEKYLGKFAWLNITVTHAMKNYLIEEFGYSPSSITTLHDRPGSQFKPLEESGYVKEEVLVEHPIFKGVPDISSYKLLVSSTSFTPDEDFGILLDALKFYDESKASHETPVFLIVTGKGPLKDQFLARVTDLKFSDRVIIRNAWLSAEDYPTILSLADLGISLHTSSSGIDLPMKIVDFFGVGVPVISLSFPAIGELVVNNLNGLTINPKEETTKSKGEELYRLLTEVLSDEKQLLKLKAGALAESKKRWDANWSRKLASKFPECS
ncbi:hypothetical protein FT663_00506 [Candidozyma haemuli var. vulneris]|uniref:Chitobiosyldiphosphodolichol beta-mannosyltransferase n=1 Tax=Candidozyma haemuli TaxID=45357 RepID=A0A2V1AQU3_9ASCO|nr:hypothetical protein CXQ85_002230 [[Candida] haemuloni]KAF3993483.1 hypothetical protein FT662_00612 [[Candida] haemuloni var. vulneris]KAF3995453.1 hypothetical protein FT663_00506 [[Candida] haemuloni var. vulneris]PVH20440.1 hypothetical protein CXQ85_002230 [[Candida] haemuloni]